MADDREKKAEAFRSADVIVVGAGHNGCIAACYLAKAGLDVLIVERHREPGGMSWTEPMPAAGSSDQHCIDPCILISIYPYRSRVGTDEEVRIATASDRSMSRSRLSRRRVDSLLAGC